MTRDRSHRLSRRSALVALAAAFFIAVPSLALAEDVPTTNMTRVGAPVSGKETALTRIQRMVVRVNKEASTPEGEAAVVARLAAQLRVTPETLRAEHDQWGLGYGEVAMVYGFARSSRKLGTTPDQVVDLRKGGASWETIAKDLGIKIDAVASRMKRHVGAKAAAKTK